ncbi:hypothetical protein H6P81_017430 [Aristolochia fimbriata]|uniref:Uncharacterized protein n=1 Tax=Aristolochia fimbriata TaxID=158543 RepID=A0AAV7DZI9_ARIFI|nr:hypothetical protein H6P81_017430 [Aristolochia fimbriata]
MVVTGDVHAFTGLPSEVRIPKTRKDSEGPFSGWHQLRRETDITADIFDIFARSSLPGRPNRSPVITSGNNPR